MMMKIAYIAHPVAGDVSGNVQKILNIVKEINMSREDVVPFAPYITDLFALNDDIPEERNRGIKNGIQILRSGMVDELWVYGPKISGGMEAEIEMAWELDIPIVVMDKETIWPTWLKHMAVAGY